MWIFENNIFSLNIIFIQCNNKLPKFLQKKPWALEANKLPISLIGLTALGGLAGDQMFKNLSEKLRMVERIYVCVKNDKSVLSMLTWNVLISMLVAMSNDMLVRFNWIQLNIRQI